MLVMKGWLETRWRLLALFVYLLIFMAINYQSHNAPAANARSMLIGLGTLLTCGTLTLAGSGVKSQSPAGFPEGLVGSTQFTIALPVSRLRLLAVRTAIGLLETSALTMITGCLAWALFPSLRASATPADFARLILTALLFQAVPYGAAVLFVTFLEEPLSMVLAGWTITFLLWVAHRIGPAVDVIRICGQASPLITHRLPWSQAATCAGLALILFLAAVRVVQTREY
jgi:hypothetical protein